MKREKGKSWRDIGRQYMRIADNLPLADRDDLQDTPQVRLQNARRSKALQTYNRYVVNLSDSNRFQSYAAKHGYEAALDLRFPRSVYQGGERPLERIAA